MVERDAEGNIIGQSWLWDGKTSLDLSAIGLEEWASDKIYTQSDKEKGIVENAEVLRLKLEEKGVTFTEQNIIALGKASASIDALSGPKGLITAYLESNNTLADDGTMIRNAITSMTKALSALGEQGIVKGVVDGIIEEKTPEQLSEMLGGEGTLLNPYGPLARTAGASRYVTCIEGYRMVFGAGWPNDETRYPKQSFAAAYHNGVGFRGILGEAYYAATDGDFTLSFNRAEGLVSKLQMSNGNILTYAHGGIESIGSFVSAWASGGAAKISESGVAVEAGDVIGRLGMTGYSGGPHLHLGLTNRRGQALTLMGSGAEAFYNQSRFNIFAGAKHLQGFKEKLPYNSAEMVKRITGAYVDGMISKLDYVSYLNKHSASTTLMGLFGMTEFWRLYNE